MADFQGRKSQYILSPHFNKVTLATDGFPFVNVALSFESNSLGLREAGEIVIKSANTKDATDRDHLEGYEVTGKIPMLQTDLPAIKNMYLYSKGPCQALFTMPDGTFLNFTDPGTDLSTPTGSTLLGVKPKFILDAKRRAMEIELDGWLYKETLDWLMDNNNAAATGGSGGTSRGLTAMSYDRTKKKRANILDLKINGNSIGWFKDDFKFELTGEGVKLTPGMTAVNSFLLSVECTLQQMSKTEIKAINDAMVNDWVFEIVTMAETIKINNPGSATEIKFDEKEPGGKIMFGGRWYRNASEVTPNFIDFGVTDPDIWEFKSTWA